MGVRLGYRESTKPKNRVAKYKCVRSFKVYTYRDEHGVERTIAKRYTKWGRNPDYVDDNEEDK